MPMLLIGLGAGIVSALLFVAFASGSVLSIILFYLAPLPVMLAGLGFSHFAALTAVLAAVVGLGIGAGIWFATAYLGGIGVPAYVLSYLAMLARPAASGDLEWYPVGRIVLWAAALAAIAMALTIPVFGLDIDTYRTGLREVFERVLRLQFRTPAGEELKLPSGASAASMLDVLVVVMPPLAATISMLTHIVNLYLAGRISRASSRLTRPWPDLSATAFPAVTPLALLAVILLSFLHSLTGVAAGIFASCLLMAYALVGLAVLHHVTRGNPLRGFLLGLSWTLIIVLGWPLVLFTLIGLADGIFDLRRRLGPPNSNPNQT